MIHPNLVITGLTLLCIVVLFGCIILVHWRSWKKVKAMKDDAIQREVESYKFINDEHGGKYIFAPYIPLTKQVADKGTFCPRCGGLFPVCPC